MPTRRLSTGERFSKVLPDFAATNSPLMKLRICFCAIAVPRYALSAFLRSGAGASPSASRFAILASNSAPRFAADSPRNRNARLTTACISSQVAPARRAAIPWSGAASFISISSIPKSINCAVLTSKHFGYIAWARMRSCRSSNFRIEGAGYIDARLDTRRHEANQIPVDCAALLGALLLVRVCTDSFANNINTYARGNHRVLLDWPSRAPALAAAGIGRSSNHPRSLFAHDQIHTCPELPAQN